jgi:hypothetical protein
MRKQLSVEKRAVVLFGACGAILATFPTLVLLPMRHARWISDPPYFMGVGFCLALSIVCLAKAITFQVNEKSKSSTTV